MKKLLFLAALACIVSTTTTTATAATTPASSIEEVTVKPPKKKGFNYKAHSQRNRASAQRAGKKFKRSGGDLTRYKCR